MFNYNPAAYGSRMMPAQVNNIFNNGTDARCTYNGNQFNVSKNGAQVAISGKLANGDSFSLSMVGDPHATVTITGADGKVKSQQKFDFKEDSAFKLPDGSVLCIGTKGAAGGATYADRLAMIAPDGSAMTVSNIFSPGQLQVSTEKINGSPIDFLNRNIATDGQFDGNLYKLGSEGLTTEFGQRVDQSVVNNTEARDNNYSSQRFGQEMAQYLMGRGLTPRCCDCYQNGLLDLQRFERLLEKMAQFGGLLPMRDRDGCNVLANLPGMCGYDHGAFGGDCHRGALDDFLNQMPQWQAPACSINPGMACATLANYFANHGMKEMTSSQLRELAGRGHGPVSRAAATLLQQPNMFDYLDGMNGSARDGRVNLDALRQMAEINGILSGSGAIGH